MFFSCSSCQLENPDGGLALIQLLALDRFPDDQYGKSENHVQPEENGSLTYFRAESLISFFCGH